MWMKQKVFAIWKSLRYNPTWCYLRWWSGKLILKILGVDFKAEGSWRLFFVFRRVFFFLGKAFLLNRSVKFDPVNEVPVFVIKWHVLWKIHLLTIQKQLRMKYLPLDSRQREGWKVESKATETSRLGWLQLQSFCLCMDMHELRSAQTKRWAAWWTSPSAAHCRPSNKFRKNCSESSCCRCLPKIFARPGC